MITQNLIDNPINLESTTNQNQINLIIDHFCDIILEAANKTIGQTNTQLKKKKQFPGGIKIVTMQSRQIKKH